MTKKSEIPFGAKEIFERPLSYILVDLESANKYVKRQALEALAIYLTRLINLQIRDWLLRTTKTNDVEVELIADDKRIPFSTWQIQCRAVKQVDMGEVASAIGRSISARPNILLSVTTGYFTQQARYYAARTAQLTNYQILLINGDDLQSIANDEKMIWNILEREANLVRAAKLQIN